MSRIPAVDPWGKSYYVNIANADPASEAPLTMQWVVVISAGPDGQLDSEENEVLKDGPQPADDDILAYVK